VIPPYLWTIQVEGAHLPDISDRLDLAAKFAWDHSGICIFHLLMDFKPDMDHSTFNSCDYNFGKGSFYQHWKEDIAFSTKACYRCGAPYKHQQFRHGDILGNACPNEGLQELLRPLGFIVWCSPPLRKAVFGHLGIPLNSFVSLDQDKDFAMWLGLSSCGSAHLSNLIEIVFAVASLKEANQLPYTQEFDFKQMQ
jgi:hypothetical protein